jgi:predicted ribosomally synthesized peptide with SipW-like signal peptide
MIAAMPLRGLRAHTMLRWGLFGALGMGLLSLSAGSGTLAYFTTQVQSNNNTFTAGNLRFNILDSITHTGQYPSVGSSLSNLNMKPGDVVYAPIQLNNVGNIDARYGVKYTVTSVLATNSDVNGGVSAPSSTQLLDSGRTATNGLSFLAPAYGNLVNDYVVITGGIGVTEFHKISGVTADTLTTSAFSATLDGTTKYSVVNFAGLVVSATNTSITTAGTPWLADQYAGYTVTDGALTSKVVSNTTSTLTVSPAFGGATPTAPSAADFYTITPTNLAPALSLGIVGKGALGTAAVSPPTTGVGVTGACNALNYADSAVFTENAVSLTSPFRALAPLNPAGETVLLLDGTHGAPMVATSGTDVLCMQVTWPDGGDPNGLTINDNAYNGAKAGAYSTNINFVFDGQ